MHHGEISRAPAAPNRLNEATTAWMVAAALALLLSLSWLIRTYPALSTFRLPDNDDMMRLAEVRDWLNGQPFRDLMQYRLGIDGASMHWSRIADAGPAALVLIFRPFLGNHGAEVAMLIAYPMILFAIAIGLIGTLTARFAPSARIIGVILGALAFPSSSLFVPGRIDHHALQIVLTLALVDRVILPPTLRRGAAAGLLVALSLGIGLETMPFVLAAMAVLGLRFLIDGAAERDRLIGFGAALGGSTLLMLVAMRPHVWPGQWCDGFTPASSNATLIAAAFFLALGASTVAPVARDWRVRLGGAAVLGLVALPAVYGVASVCLNGPYGALDPMLKDLWMSKVGEALGIFNQTRPGDGFRFGAYGLFGMVVMLWLLRRDGWKSRMLQGLAVIIVLTALVSLVQIRVDYVLSAVVVAPIAVIVHRIRRIATNLAVRLGVWIVAAGIGWNIVGLQINSLTNPPETMTEAESVACSGPDEFVTLRRLPPGRIIAPLDIGAYIIGGTAHRSLAAPYHRNNAGNLAMYKLFLGTPDTAEAIARQWRADYIVFCPGSFGELDPLPDDRRMLIGRLRAGHPPAWLERVRSTIDGPRIYRVLPPALAPTLLPVAGPRS